MEVLDYDDILLRDCDEATLDGTNWLNDQVSILT